VLNAASAEQVAVLFDVLPDTLRGVAGDVFDVVGCAVVAVLAVQPGHRGDVLLHIRRQSQFAQLLKKFVEGRSNRGDGTAQGLGILLGDLFDVQRCRAGQFIDRTEVVLGCAQHRGDDVGDIAGCHGRGAAGSERQRQLSGLPD
jgi:hypothetical protein